MQKIKRGLFPGIGMMLLYSTAWGAPPNVIIIMADDLGYECVEAYGGESYATPSLTRMAKEGVQFDHAHSQPICTPSRVQIMTGKYNVRNYTRFATLDQSLDTFGHAFRNAGYATCIVGKWQLGGNAQTMDAFGFDEHCLWRINGADEERYVSPVLLKNGKPERFTGQYGPDIQQAFAKDFIVRHKDLPFFLYYPITLPHYPFQPTPDSPDWDPARDPYFNDTKYFGDMVTYLDKLVGDLLDFIEARGLAENTLIIFAADNGTDHRITTMHNGTAVQGGKGRMTDAGTHVPMFAVWKNTIQPNRVIRDLVDFSDIYSTIIDAADISISAEEAKEKDGISVLPQMKTSEGSPRDHSYCWYMERTDMTDIKQFVQNRTYKLYATGRFYNRQLDLLEKYPLGEADLTADEAALKSRFSDLLQQYAALRPLRIPFNNSRPVALPGKIRAMCYDLGLEGDTYHDTTRGNAGGKGYRTEDVDIVQVDRKNVIGQIADGEWLDYSVKVEKAGAYLIDVRYLAESNEGRIYFKLNGKVVSDPARLPATDSGGKFSTVRLENIFLPAGEHVLTAFFDVGGMVVESFNIEEARL